MLASTYPLVNTLSSEVFPHAPSPLYSRRRQSLSHIQSLVTEQGKPTARRACAAPFWSPRFRKALCRRTRSRVVGFDGTRGVDEEAACWRDVGRESLGMRSCLDRFVASSRGVEAGDGEGEVEPSGSQVETPMCNRSSRVRRRRWKERRTRVRRRGLAERYKMGNESQKKAESEHWCKVERRGWQRWRPEMK